MGNLSTTFSFENNDWGDFSYTGQVSLVNNSGVATDGNYYVNMVSQPTSKSSLTSFLGASTSDSIFSSATEGSAVKITLNLDANVTVNFDWSFVNQETSYNSYYNDISFATTNGQTTLLTSSNLVPRGQTAWQTFSYPITNAGSYTLGMGVMNWRDTAVEAKLYLDNFEVIGNGSSQDVEDALSALNTATASYDAAVAAEAAAQSSLSTATSNAAAVSSTLTAKTTAKDTAISEYDTAVADNTTAQNNLTTAQAASDAAATDLTTKTAAKVSAEAEYDAAVAVEAAVQSSLSTTTTDAATASSTLTAKTTAKDTAISEYDTAVADNTTAQGNLTAAQAASDAAIDLLATETSEKYVAQTALDLAQIDWSDATDVSDLKEGIFDAVELVSDASYTDWQASVTDLAEKLEIRNTLEPLQHQIDRLIIPAEHELLGSSQIMPTNFELTSAHIDLVTGDLQINYSAPGGDGLFADDHSVTIKNHLIDPIDLISIDINGDRVLETFDVAQQFYADTDGNTLLIGSHDASGESLIGAGGNDWFIANAGDDIIVGGAGADTIDGGAGIDEIDYSRDAASGGSAGVTVNLSAGTATDGFGTSDQLSNIENITGTDQDDQLTGSDADNIIIAGAGDDVLIGGAGNNFVDGGAGAGDIVSFYQSSTGVVVDLQSGADVVHSDGTDTIRNIENIEGTLEADSLIGDGGSNFLFGKEGDDIIAGGLGADQLSGGSGNDHFIYEAGDSTSDEMDEIIDFEAGGDGSDGTDKVDISSLVNGTFVLHAAGHTFEDNDGNTQAKFENTANANTKILQIDADGDAQIDQEIKLTVADGGVLDESDLQGVG